MKIHLLIALVGLAISFALPTFAQEQSAVDPETRQEIEAVAMQSVEAYNKHDAAAIAALYTLDAVRVLDRGGSTNFVGRDAIEKYYEDRLQKLHFSNHIIKFDPDSPHVIGTAGVRRRFIDWPIQRLEWLTEKNAGKPQAR
jgi:SnoaL-like domain